MRSLKHLHAYLIAGGLLAAFFLLLLRFVPPRASDPVRFAELHATKDEVSVADQPVGANVKVAEASLSAPGFIVIQDDEQGPGKMLGASQYLPAGAQHAFGISLKNTLTSGYYYAVSYRDDGDGAFDASKDVAAKNADGSLVSARFLVAP